MPAKNDNGWPEWKKLVLANQKEMKKRQEKTATELTGLRIDFETFAAGMKVRAGVWGLLGGLLPAIGVLLVLVLKD